MNSSPSSSWTRLYEEAEQNQPGEPRDPAEDLSPLYHALKRSKSRYREEEPIGAGGMKEIFRVYDEHTERHVALARPKEGIGAERYDAFLREAHITARLEHPNIINLFDMGIDDLDRPFFTMEFKRGDSMRRILSKLRKGEGVSDYPYERRLSAFLRVCEAMAYAHARHVLHLDLKPENIQVGTFGEVQVCDWGMGEIVQGRSEEPFSEALLDPDLYGGQLDPPVKGTPGYMPPEQKDPKAAKTVANDIYALGCLLYELSTLKPLTMRENKRPDSPAIAAIVNKACATEPGKRYARVEELQEDVSRHLLGFSPEAEQAGFFREARLLYRRNRVPCLITFYFTLFLAGIAIWFAHQLREENRITAGALKQTNIALAEAEKERTFAREAQARAEDAVARHRQERDFAVALLETRSGSPLDRALFLTDFLMMKKTISLPVIENTLAEIDKYLAEEPPTSDRLWTIKAHILFLIQRFNEAETYYAIRVGDQDGLRTLIPEFAPRVNDDGLLSAADFIRLIQALANERRSRHPLIEKMVIYDTIKRESPAESAEILKAVLQISNPEWDEPVLDYQAENESLRLSGAGLSSLYRSGARRDETTVPVRSLLRLLEVRSLDLRGTDIADLWHLEGLRLRRLDLRGTPAEGLEPIAGMTSLRELIIEPGQFSSEQLDMLPRTVSVTELPAEED